MEYAVWITRVQEYVMQFFQAERERILPYHNELHTLEMVEAARQISNHYQLSEQEIFVVTTAAWLHGLGYYSANSQEPEKEAAAQARTVLTAAGVDDALIEQVAACILASRLPQEPAGKLEQILCDAVLFDLGSEAFPEKSKLMRKEAALISQEDIGKEEWRQQMIELLQNHHYHTDYCRVLLEAKKKENLKRLVKKEEKKAAEEEKALLKQQETPKEIVPKENAPKKKEKKPTRGIETMFRVAVTNQQRLSDMADRKASIMISVNSIIISVVIGLVVHKPDVPAYFLVPTLFLLGGCVIVVIFSVLATRPKIPDGQFTEEQIRNRSVNLLFFGHFYKMNYEQYYHGMKEVMKDKEFLYGSLIKDVYSQGVVLGRKFRFLRVSYTLFMYILIVAVAAYGISFIFFS